MLERLCHRHGARSVIRQRLNIVGIGRCNVRRNIRLRRSFVSGLRRYRPDIALLARHRVVGGVCRTIGFRRGIAEALGLFHRVAEIAQALVAQRGPLLLRLGDRIARALGRLGLDLSDRFLQRQPLLGDVGFLERRLGVAQLIDQRAARALVQRAAVLAGVLLEAADGAGNQGIIVSHYLSFSLNTILPGKRPPASGFFTRHVSNGLVTRIVSSRSGLVDNKATGQPTSSSIRLTYFIACAGNCAQDRARAVGSFQPSMVS